MVFLLIILTKWDLSSLVIFQGFFNWLVDVCDWLYCSLIHMGEVWLRLLLILGFGLMGLRCYYWGTGPVMPNEIGGQKNLLGGGFSWPSKNYTCSLLMCIILTGLHWRWYTGRCHQNWWELLMSQTVGRLGRHHLLFFCFGVELIFFVMGNQSILICVDCFTIFLAGWNKAWGFVG